MKILKTGLLSTLISITILNFASAQLPTYVPSNGLIGWYPFTGNANDSSGNANHATVNGALLAADRFGVSNAAYAFNGNSDYLQGNAATFPTLYRTIALWFYSANIDLGTTGMQVFGYGGGLCGQSWLMQMDNPTPATSFFTDKTFEVSIGCDNWISALPFGANGTPLNPNNNWHHWVMTNSPSGVDFYIDGNYAGGITTPVSGTEVAAKKFFIGACPDSSGTMAYQDAYMKHWNGSLDDVGIWNRALSQQEITDLYNGAGAVAVTDISGDNTIQIFPNPVENILNIKLTESQLGKAYSIVDVLGRSLINGMITDIDSTIDVSKLSKGVYILKFDAFDNSGFKIIKN